LDTDNLEYREVIDRHVSQESLKALVVDLIKKHAEDTESNLEKRWINGIVTKIKGELRQRTSTIPPTEIDFYNIILENEKVKKFNQIATDIKREKIIDRKEIRGFKIVAKTVKFSGAGQLKNKSGRMLAFAEAFQKYENPYAFLNALKEIELSPVDYFKFFVDIEYQTLNKHNVSVSGGERSEFNLLHEISDALQYDILLIDEPESSFDNLFLKNDVNGLLKEISSEIPVVIVTHNSTVGASIKPDYVVYTKKIVENNQVVYKLYHGYPSDRELKSLEGDVIDNYEVLLNCLEAGHQAYTDRRNVTYEVLKN
jgi:ABC-type histidine transport system ATPase subunit